MVTANIIDLSGNSKGEVTLPAVFDEVYRPDIIKKVVLSYQANRYQPYGPKMYAGMETSARSWGSGRGVAQIPRLANGSRAARVPQAKGGRRAHPPKPEADRTEKINKKEKKMAIRSAIAATVNEDLVKTRGHKFPEEGRFQAVFSPPILGPQISISLKNRIHDIDFSLRIGYTERPGARFVPMRGSFLVRIGR